jgi:ABC-type transport system involved in multi-copper enzyme maturation permease subunit
MKLWAVALNTCREAVRNKILYSVVFFAVILLGISAFFGSVTIGDRVKVIKDFGLFSLSFFGAIITILSGTTLLNKELKQKTVYNILSKPIERWQFIAGKFLGIWMTVSLLTLLMGLGLTGFCAAFEGRFDPLLLQGTAFCILELMIVAAVTIFFSSLVVTITLSGMFTLGAYIAGKSVEYLVYFTRDGENRALVALVRAAELVLPDLSLFNLSNQLVYGVPATLAQFNYGAAYAAAYSVVMVGLASLIFDRRELI